MSYHHPSRHHRPCQSSNPPRRPIYQISPLLRLPNELLLRILTLLIVLESPNGQLTTPLSPLSLKCACVPLIPIDRPPKTAKLPFRSRLKTALQRPWYENCVRLCDRIDLWAADPCLPHLHPSGRMVNLAITRTCLRLHPLAVDALYALNTITITSAEVRCMTGKAARMADVLRKLRIVERTVEESIWVQAREEVSEMGHMLFAEMAYLLDQIYQQYKARGSRAACELAHQWRAYILQYPAAELGYKTVSQSKALPGEDPSLNNDWTKAFAVKVAEARYRAEKTVQWKARR